MSSSKKLMTNLSKELNEEIRKKLKKKYKKKSEFIRDTLILYIEDKKKLSKIDELKKGYIEMAQINLELSETGFVKDMSQLKEYEAKLAESDLPDDNGSEKRRYILC
ncbi:CopG family transcriptional regulator [Clostridium ganghwense]|uniref:CopG family transcriptional regulator n=1 Tax=Clostridium ganghwense TaxID=312089 RepID=A0ABT4CTB1_9CLOT|nr:CopG family transcriptional regulator [Clostridium ganghwense]MCY6371281.1 CopG family transcriptional regulator [Clostridium ganghwense]